MTTTAVPGPPGYRGAADAAPNGVRAGMWVADTGERDEVVLFMIGMRINRLRRVRHWWWVTRQMPKMLAELAATPDSPVLATKAWLGGRDLMVSQVWRSAEELGRFARDPAGTHAPAWREFNRRLAACGDVGIWHETYVCPAGAVESLYGNTTPIGLGSALGLRPVGERRGTSAERRVQGGAAKAQQPGL